MDARTRPATPVEPLGRRESDKRRVKEVCGGMRCIDLLNRAWPVTGQGATTFARYLKLFGVLFLKSLREKSRESRVDPLAALKVFPKVPIFFI